LSFYQRRILPRLISFGMGQKQLRPLRERLIAGARGRVLEIGIGSGLNMPFYSREVDTLLGIDPSAPLLQMARKHTAWTHFPVELTEGRAEDIPLDDRSVDHVVMTWTLCSIADAPRALAEIRRVLRPGGQLHFLEHGRSPDPAVAKWQDRLTPLQKRVFGGCHLNRPVDRLVDESGLETARLENFQMKGPKAIGYMYEGVAVRPA
jgi:ubiquinone/menaquinone biosynthesis C-methylase UbiE